MIRCVPGWLCAPAFMLAWLLPQTSEVSKTSEVYADTPGGRGLFTMHCGKCHGKDGKGGPARTLFPDIPDFTNAGWQSRRRDPQLLVSILEGKGTDMPAFQGKIDKQQARGLVRQVRHFAPKKKDTKAQPQGELEQAFERLEKQFADLQEELRKLSRNGRDWRSGRNNACSHPH